jgi:hypothetical protein
MARAYLYRVNDLRHVVELFPTQWDKQDDPKFASSNLYIFGSKWLSRTSLELKVSGHGDNLPRFTLIYQWNLNEPSKLIERLSKEDDTRDVPSSQEL